MEPIKNTNDIKNFKEYEDGSFEAKYGNII